MMIAAVNPTAASALTTATMIAKRLVRSPPPAVFLPRIAASLRPDLPETERTPCALSAGCIPLACVESLRASSRDWADADPAVRGLRAVPCNPTTVASGSSGGAGIAGNGTVPLAERPTGPAPRRLSSAGSLCEPLPESFAPVVTFWSFLPDSLSTFL